jgi:integrase
VGREVDDPIPRQLACFAHALDLGFRSTCASIQRRGRRSWRIRIEDGVDAAGRRKRHTVTFTGTRQEAQRELTRLLGAADAGTLVEPSKATVAEYLRAWLDGPHGLSPKTAERYKELAEQQIIPHLGNKLMQRLKPHEVQSWHETLLKSGGKGGRALSARTVGHGHRVLRRALQKAVASEVLARNVAAVISPPKVTEEEIEILTEDQINLVIDKLAGHPLYEIAVVDLATGMRRGELLALRLSDVDLDRATVRIERSLEETREGLRFKAPKTANGKRTISLPANAVAVLRDHRQKLLETRMALGLGKPNADTLLFGEVDGSPRRPDQLSWLWRSACKSLKLPMVSFHALRHTHASALIAAGLDVVLIARRLGHGSPHVTLRVYGHLFKRDDTAAARAIEAVMRTRRERPPT